MFKDGNTIRQISFANMVAWRSGQATFSEKPSRLLLPPIQRSLVWSNEQIINFWDSLLRGYPTGMMLVHRARTSDQGYDAEQKLQDAQSDDYQLFDGQQRMAAILLGFGKGALAENRQIWVDVSDAQKPGSQYRFALRMQSSGQPCGYQMGNPNAKHELEKRHEWLKKNGECRGEMKNPRCGDTPATWYFKNWKQLKPLAGEACYPLHELIAKVDQQNWGGIFRGDAGQKTQLEEFQECLKKVLEQKLVVQLIDEGIVNDPDEYARFFTRIGQGGTRLSEDELIYSMIKQHFPEVRVGAERIAGDSKAGRLMGEVDLVLAVLRSCKVLAKSTQAIAPHLLASRPNPKLVGKLNEDDSGFSCVKQVFVELFEPQSLPLLDCLRALRDALKYQLGIDKHNGLPDMLLARLPRELLDVLLLLTLSARSNADAGWRWPAEGAHLLRLLSLYWLNFIEKGDRAAQRIFELHLASEPFVLNEARLRGLIHEFESTDVALQFAYPAEVDLLIQQVGEVPASKEILRHGEARFSKADHDDCRPGQAIRIISTNGERIKRSLFWLQRDFLAREYTEFDPTMALDQDMPIDLDHLIPYNKFGFHWGERYDRIVLGELDNENFRYRRHMIGNSLGNYRWLDSSENRKRQDKPIAGLENDGNCLNGCDLDEWNMLIRPQNENPWCEQDVVQFQRLIDLRTLQLYERMLDESGLSDLLLLKMKHERIVG